MPLITKLSSGARQATPQSYAAGGPPCGGLLGVARQVLRDEGTAQDALQQAYLDLWRQTSRYGPGRSAIGPWLVMLTHPRAVDRVRREQKGPRPIDRLADLAGDVNVEEHTNTSVLGGQTVALLRRLPARQSQCLLLAYWDGYTMSEIAKGLDIPVGTVKSNCRMALQTLSLLLHEQESDETIDELFRRADAAFYDTRKRR